MRKLILIPMIAMGVTLLSLQSRGVTQNNDHPVFNVDCQFEGFTKNREVSCVADLGLCDIRTVGAAAYTHCVNTLTLTCSNDTFVYDDSDVRALFDGGNLFVNSSQTTPPVQIVIEDFDEEGTFDALLRFRQGPPTKKERPIRGQCEVSPLPLPSPSPSPSPSPTPTPTASPSPTPTPSPTPDQGCTLTIGYWQTHEEDVAPLLPINLGSGGGKTVNVTTTAIADSILSFDFCDDPGNGFVQLYAQMLAAKLNIENGANGAVIATQLAAADAFLVTYACADWDSLTNTQQQQVRDWAEAFENFNSGATGPGHCD